MNVQTLTKEQMSAIIAQLTADNAKLRQSVPAPKALSMKVSEKGALSLYGLGRFPVTLYASQWERVLASTTQISQFLKANESTLKRGE